jgi:hypothetical protein
MRGPQKIHGVRDETEWLRHQRDFGAKQRLPFIPFESELKPQPVLEPDGVVRLKCPICGAWPTSSVAPNLCCCYGCGAIYRDLPPVEPA